MGHKSKSRSTTIDRGNNPGLFAGLRLVGAPAQASARSSPKRSGSVVRFVHPLAFSPRAAQPADSDEQLAVIGRLPGSAA